MKKLLLIVSKGRYMTWIPASMLVSFCIRLHIGLAASSITYRHFYWMTHSTVQNVDRSFDTTRLVVLSKYKNWQVGPHSCLAIKRLFTTCSISLHFSLSTLYFLLYFSLTVKSAAMLLGHARALEKEVT